MLRGIFYSDGLYYKCMGPAREALLVDPVKSGFTLQIKGGQTMSFESQLRLGPIKRSLDRLKFNMQGGYSQKWGVVVNGWQQSGTSIESFKNDKVSDYIFFAGSKHKKVTNATITQFVTADEASWPANTTLPFS